MMRGSVFLGDGIWNRFLHEIMLSDRRSAAPGDVGEILRKT
jgi:hypothetical protein